MTGFTAANENASMHALVDGAHLKAAGGRVFLARRGAGAPAAGTVALAIVDGSGRHTVQLSPEEARFLAAQLLAPCGALSLGAR
jgi:hypothetical protein